MVAEGGRKNQCPELEMISMFLRFDENKYQNFNFGNSLKHEENGDIYRYSIVYYLVYPTNLKYGMRYARRI